MKLPGKGMSWRTFFKALKNEYKKDALNDVAAGLTFFAVLAIFPFLLFMVALAGLIIDPAQTQALVGEASQVAPPQATEILGNQLKSISEGSSGGLLTFGIVGAIWAASGGMAALTRALNTVYDVEEGRPFWKVRLIAIGMTLFAGAMALVATLVAIATPAVANAVGGPLGTAINLLRLPVAGLIMMFVWAVLYWALPDVEQKFKFITPGSVIGVVIWMIASLGFSIYVGNFGKYEATYGALGGVIVLLLWMWISSQVVLLGAEINSIIEHASAEGKVPGAKSLADRGEAHPEAESPEEARRMPPPGREAPPPDRTLH